MKKHVLTTTPGWSGDQCQHKVEDSEGPNCKDNDVCVNTGDTIKWKSSDPSQTASVTFKPGRTPCSNGGVFGPDDECTVSAKFDKDPNKNVFPYKLTTTRGTDHSVVCEEDPKIIIQNPKQGGRLLLGLGLAILVGIAIYGLRPRSSDD